MGDIVVNIQFYYNGFRDFVRRPHDANDQIPKGIGVFNVSAIRTMYSRGIIEVGLLFLLRMKDLDKEETLFFP